VRLTVTAGDDQQAQEPRAHHAATISAEPGNAVVPALRMTGVVFGRIEVAINR